LWEPALGKVLQNDAHLFMTSGIMAARGYPTWDVAIVMNDFAKKYPEYVSKFLAAECKGIDYWISKPAETAKIIAKELNLKLEDATRMMKGTEMVPCQKQLTDQYLGTSAKKGGFITTLMATSKFLADNKRLPKVPEQKTFESFIQPGYLEKM